jgi:hypothetical protein
MGKGSGGLDGALAVVVGIDLARDGAVSVVHAAEWDRPLPSGQLNIAATINHGAFALSLDHQ